MDKKVGNRDNVVPVRRKKKSKPVTGREIGILVAAVILLFGILLYVFLEGSMDTILVEGNETYTQDEVEQVIRESKMNNTIFFTVLSKFSKNDYLPFIDRAEVRFLGMHAVMVEVHEELRAGMIQEGSGYFYFDKDGMVLETSDTRMKDVPLVSGLKMEDCVLNEKIEPREEGVFAIILKITQLILNYELPIQEIQFNTLSDIRLVTTSITVKMGNSSELDAKMAELPSVLKELSGREGTLNMANFTEENKVISFMDREVEEAQAQAQEQVEAEAQAQAEGQVQEEEQGQEEQQEQEKEQDQGQ
ncbi:MAG: cell division protein FtsQ/DivIB [Lachnospiraceae bacterium]|nr:cell division protein FtsQ/DivIB [Lachnospiraceae bacterium]